MGRPAHRPAGLLDPDLRQRLVTALTAGGTRADACAYAGVSYGSLKRWLARGRDCAERHAELLEHGGEDIVVLDDPDWPYFELLVAVEEAESKPTMAALGVVGTLMSAIKDDPEKGIKADPALALKAATWYLRYHLDRKTLASTLDTEANDEALRAEGLALVEELERREAALAEEIA